MGEPGVDLLPLYDAALPQVYGYLLARCGDRTVAEDLTSETFLAAVIAPGPLSTAWLVGTARHKLVDHWRRLAREERGLRLVHESNGGERALDDPWDARLDVLRAREVLARLGPHHRAALVLRHLDGLPVPEVAQHLGRDAARHRGPAVPGPSRLPQGVRGGLRRCLSPCATRSTPFGCRPWPSTPTRPSPSL